MNMIFKIITFKIFQNLIIIITNFITLFIKIKNKYYNFIMLNIIILMHYIIYTY